MNAEHRSHFIELVNRRQEIEPLIEEYGSGSPVVTIVACMHGNELVGINILESLKGIESTTGTLRLVVANPNAVRVNKRFVDHDLNKSFPGSESGDVEDQLAYKLKEKLSDTDVLIDLHTTTAATPAFIIARNIDEDARALITASGIERIVVKPKPGKTALIDWVANGIGIELGQHGSKEARRAAAPEQSGQKFSLK